MNGVISVGSDLSSFFLPAERIVIQYLYLFPLQQPKSDEPLPVVSAAAAARWNHRKQLEAQLEYLPVRRAEGVTGKGAELS